jgi:class 3 adenylate cyclase
VTVLSYGERERLVSYLTGRDPRLVKFAVQRMCATLERHNNVRLSQHVVTLLSFHLASQDVYVRRWLYKLVGLSRERAWQSWLQGQLRGRETDPENLTWAVAALFALEPNALIPSRLHAFGLEYAGTPYELSSRYFRPDDVPFPRRVMMYSAESENALAPMWLALLRARVTGVVDADVIRSLVSHHDPRVSEYNIWCLFHDPVATLADAGLATADIPGRRPHVRRWAYRLLGKDPEVLHAEADFVLARVREEPDERAREGLAQALGSRRLDPLLARGVAEWFSDEPDELTREALAEHMAPLTDRVPQYREALEAAPAGSLFVPVAGTDESTMIFVPRSYRGPAMITAVPRIRDAYRHQTYFLGMDTVGYSKLTDADQLAVVRDMFGALEHDDEARAVPREQSVYLSTGDGLLIGFRGDRHDLLPLKVALRLQSQMSELRGYQLRIGVHAGPVQWIHLEDGGVQLIGHAINWTARVMDKALGGEVLVSAHYYDDHAQPRRDYLPGVTFSEVREFTTKHDEPLLVRHAQVTN